MIPDELIMHPAPVVDAPPDTVPIILKLPLPESKIPNVFTVPAPPPITLPVSATAPEPLITMQFWLLPLVPAVQFPVMLIVPAPECIIVAEEALVPHNVPYILPTIEND
jgi:hypothetical protein